MNLIEREAVEKKIAQMRIFAENLGAAIDLQHGLIAELEAKNYQLDYKDATGRKELATQLSKLRRELELAEKEYRARLRAIEFLVEQLEENSCDDKTENETQRAVEAMVQLMSDPRVKQLAKGLLKDMFEAIAEANVITKIQLVGQVPIVQQSDVI